MIQIRNLFLTISGNNGNLYFHNFWKCVSTGNTGIFVYLNEKSDSYKGKQINNFFLTFYCLMRGL
jgi:hypothetical protein